MQPVQSKRTEQWYNNENAKKQNRAELEEIKQTKGGIKQSVKCY